MLRQEIRFLQGRSFFAPLLCAGRRHTHDYLVSDALVAATGASVSPLLCWPSQSPSMLVQLLVCYYAGSVSALWLCLCSGCPTICWSRESYSAGTLLCWLKVGQLYTSYSLMANKLIHSWNSCSINSYKKSHLSHVGLNTACYRECGCCSATKNLRGEQNIRLRRHGGGERQQTVFAPLAFPLAVAAPPLRSPPPQFFASVVVVRVPLPYLSRSLEIRVRATQHNSAPLFVLNDRKFLFSKVHFLEQKFYILFFLWVTLDFFYTKSSFLVQYKEQS